MNSAKLLERIKYGGPLDLSYKTLCGLQRSFLLSVPFENLDIHLGRHIEFTSEAVYNKVVNQYRGGFCYELNSLCHDLLKELGFDVDFLAASMVWDGRPGTTMGHMVLSAVADGQRWLVDVGNGKSFREPLNLDGSNEVLAEGIRYRVGRTDELGPVVLETTAAGEWEPRFMFSSNPRRRDEFLEVCEWTQTSRESKFTQKRICTMARPSGRVTFLDGLLTIEEEGNVRKETIGQERFDACLKEHFGVSLGK